MGQCGCGDTTPDYQFPGPDGVIYAIQIYQSCHDCQSPAGVEIYRFDPNSEDTEDWVRGVPELDFMGYPHDDTRDAQAFISVLDPEHMVAALVKVAEEDGDDRPQPSETAVRFALPEAVYRTLSAWKAPATPDADS